MQQQLRSPAGKVSSRNGGGGGVERSSDLAQQQRRARQRQLQEQEDRDRIHRERGIRFETVDTDEVANTDSVGSEGVNMGENEAAAISRWRNTDE